uniref:uncharacterized protein LOC109962592 isoform X2 n=1 Tax=Monopterus albus TaxID=43700 RepID=UPI0009B4D517|nr:uncharacterized protein LOC109962592 isoform X2 [Monopterus albus]
MLGKLCWLFRDGPIACMEGATSSLLHSDSPEPLQGAQQASGPQPPAPGPSGAPCPGVQHQQHHKPFFYIQPPQPYLPMQSLQWPVPMPMPLSYNPYFGYPGVGFGMPMMPHYQPNPYISPPGFVVPHSHLHLKDYRRMLNPQHYQTMTHHSRRFHYQHKGPTREMINSEVQTEPVSATQRNDTASSSNVASSGVLPVCHSDSPSVPTSPVLSPALAVQKGDHLVELKNMVPSSITGRPPNGSFVIQTEEMRIECCASPVVMQLMHSHETAEVSRKFSRNVVQCSSILQGRVLQDEGLCLPADQWGQTLPACPDILLAGTASTGETIPAPEQSSNQTDPMTDLVNGDFVEMSEDQSMTSKSFDLNFDPKHLDVWSIAETLSPSPELLFQSGFTETHDETFADVLSEKREAPSEEFAAMIEMPPLAEDKLEDMVPSVEGVGDEKVPTADICPLDVTEETPMIKLTCTAGLHLSHNLLSLDNSRLKGDKNQHKRETNVQDTSFESLPAYLPSTSNLEYPDHVHYCSKMPPPAKKQSKPLGNLGLDLPTKRKLDLEDKNQPTTGKPKVRYKPKGKVDRQSLSDHECCLSRGFSENTFKPYVSKMERLCSRCLEKHRICTSASPGLGGLSLKRKAVPFQQWNDALLPTCDSCKSHNKRRQMSRGSNPDVCGSPYGLDTEGESSENSSGHVGKKWRTADDPRKLSGPKRPLALKQNLEKFPTGTYSKLREKNWVYNKLPHQPVAWERLLHCPHGNTIQEMDENCAVPISFHDNRKNSNQIFLAHKWPTEKSLKAVMLNPDTEGSSNEARSQHLNKHKNSQSQGTCRKDTRW